MESRPETSLRVVVCVLGWFIVVVVVVAAVVVVVVVCCLWCVMLLSVCLLMVVLNIMLVSELSMSAGHIFVLFRCFV